MMFREKEERNVMRQPIFEVDDEAHVNIYMSAFESILLVDCLIVK